LKNKFKKEELVQEVCPIERIALFRDEACVSDQAALTTFSSIMMLPGLRRVIL